jgi:DNA-binding transcriptional LysR family regulator
MPRQVAAPDAAGAADCILLPDLSEVEVEIAASAELVDLAAEGFDAGIRLGQFIAAV